MVIAIDFDGTIVEDDRAYDDLDTPLQFKPGAKEAIMALKQAGHVLFLWSGRSNASLLLGVDHDPLVFAGLRDRVVEHEAWVKSMPLHRARFDQMCDFVEAELPGVFACITDSKARVDLFIDDKALRFGSGPGAFNWEEISVLFGMRANRHDDAGRSGLRGEARSHVGGPSPTRRAEQEARESLDNGGRQLGGGNA